jgi:hypothetical protein
VRPGNLAYRDRQSAKGPHLAALLELFLDARVVVVDDLGVSVVSRDGVRAYSTCQAGLLNIGRCPRGRRGDRPQVAHPGWSVDPWP